MFPFLSFLLLFMAVGLSSGGRSREGKATVEAPSLLEQHLPKSAHPLVTALSDDDREVLTYILAFGLRLIVCRLQCKLRKGIKGSVKASSHCGCFSCYSSFWSRWTASPNRDLLNKIIEITEMPEEEQKASKGKEKKKKQDKKRALEKETRGKKSQGGLQNVATTSTPSAVSPDSAEPVEATLATSVHTSMDKMYDALWDNGSKDEALRLAEHGLDDAGTRERVSSSRDAGESSSTGSSMHAQAPAMMDDQVDGRFATHDSPPASLCFASTQCRNNSKFQRAGKRKSKVTPWDFEGTFGTGKNQEPNMLNENAGAVSPRLGDANLGGRGFFCRVFPDTVCEIASRLWDLVSSGSRSRNTDYY